MSIAHWPRMKVKKQKKVRKGRPQLMPTTIIHAHIYVHVQKESRKQLMDAQPSELGWWVIDLSWYQLSPHMNNQEPQLPRP